MEKRGSLVDWRANHSGVPKTVMTPANTARVLAEEMAEETNTPWQATPSLRRNGLPFKPSSHRRMLKEAKFR